MPPEQPPAFSVVVPFFDSAAHIECCIDSLRSLEPIPGGHELIFVDNGARDTSRHIVERAGGGDIQLLSEPTPGAYAARNRGIAQARGALIAFTDADCSVAPDWLRALQASLEDPRVAVVVGRCDYPNTASPLLRMLAAYENAKTHYVLSSCAPAHHFVYANNLAVRAAVFADLGPFLEWRRAGDTELVHRLAQQRPHAQVRYCSSARVTHHEFVRFGHRMRRLRRYTGTNAKIPSFKELRPHQRVGVLANLLFPGRRLERR